MSDDEGLARVEERLIGLEERMGDRLAVIEKHMFGNGQPGWCADHAQRIARQELWRAWLTGALAVLSLLWTASIAIGAVLLTHTLSK